MKLVLTTFGLIFMSSVFCLWEEFAGDYYIKPKHLSKCRDSGRNTIDIPIKMSRYNKTHKVYKNNVTFPFDLGNDLMVNLAISSKGTNGHTWNILLNSTGKICEFVDKYSRKMISGIIESAGTKYQCPIKKGFYQMDYVIPDVLCNMFVAIPVFPYGEYRIEISLFSLKSNKVLIKEGCLDIYCDVRPLYEIKKCPN